MSQLKHVVGNHTPISTLPTELATNELPMVEQAAVLDTCTIHKQGLPVQQLLVHWVGQSVERANFLYLALWRRLLLEADVVLQR